MTALDFYTPRTMMGVIQKSVPLRTFFKSRFFTNVITFPTETVTFEYSQERRRLAPFVSSRIGSEALERDGYKVKTYTPPLVGVNRVINPDTLGQKLLGEQIWNSGVTPEERAAAIAARDIIELQDAVIRREELMCARVKQDGKLTIKGNGVSQEVDYEFNGIVNVATADKWDSDYDILSQLADCASDLRKSGSVNPDMLILGSDAAKALLANEAIAKLLDNRRMEYGMIAPEAINQESGVGYLGHIAAPGAIFDLYTYEEWAPDESDLDDNGRPQLKPIIDPETVIMQSSHEQNSMLYGMVTTMDSAGNHITNMTPYVPETWFEQKAAERYCSIKSRPLPMPHDITSWLVLKNVVTGTV